MKHEQEENVTLAGTDYRLHLPKEVNAVDARIGFNKGSWNLQAECAWKALTMPIPTITVRPSC